MDIDVSIEDDFTEEQLGEIESKLLSAFNTVFSDHGYHVFDFKFKANPKDIKPEHAEFWGGYNIELKIIENEKYKQFEDDEDSMRRHATIVGTGQEKKLTVDISKYEYVAPKKLEEVDGLYSVYVYTPVMIVYEKLRAICQQMEEYGRIVATHRRARARDFFDIYTIVEQWRTPVDVFEPHSINIINEVFEVKRVPLSFLLLIKNYREYHRDNFNAVRDSVNVEQRLESYDYYFDYVVGIADQLHEIISLPIAETAIGMEITE